MLCIIIFPNYHYILTLSYYAIIEYFDSISDAKIKLSDDKCTITNQSSITYDECQFWFEYFSFESCSCYIVVIRIRPFKYRNSYIFRKQK